MATMTGKQATMTMKGYLELVQPLKVKYAYPKEVAVKESALTFQDMSSSVRVGIGNQLISERRTYLVYIQTKTMEQNLFYSDCIKLGTHNTPIEWVSDSLRKDALAGSGWINTIVLRLFNSLEIGQVVYTEAEVRAMLQEIADNYIFLTSQYGFTLEDSFIDNLVVPKLEKDLYTYAEMIALKQEYMDKLILSTTEY